MTIAVASIGTIVLLYYKVAVILVADSLLRHSQHKDKVSQSGNSYQHDSDSIEQINNNLNTGSSNSS